MNRKGFEEQFGQTRKRWFDQILEWSVFVSLRITLVELVKSSEEQSGHTGKELGLKSFLNFKNSFFELEKVTSVLWITLVELAKNSDE